VQGLKVGVGYEAVCVYVYVCLGVSWRVGVKVSVCV